jgi:hypothetical protein
MMERSRRPRNCTFCMESLAIYDDKGLGPRPKIVVPCGHCFHQECIDAWLAERRHQNVPCPDCNCRIEKLIPCFCWEADSRGDDENDDAISIRFIPAIQIIIVLLDVISVLIVLLDDTRQFHTTEILALLTALNSYLIAAVTASTPPSWSLYLALIFVNTVGWARKNIITNID